MCIRLHRGKDRGDLAGLIDEVGDTAGAQILLPVQFLFTPDAVRLDEALIGVSQQRERQLILSDERFV